MFPPTETGTVRRRVGGLAGFVSAGLLTLSTSLPAQTLPLPALPEEPAAADPTKPDPAASGGPDAAAATQERARPWEYGVGVGMGWDSNIEFRVPDGPSSWAVSPRGNLARVFSGPRGQLRIGGTGSWIGYPDQASLSNYDVTLSLDGNHRSSASTALRANGSYTLGYSDSSVVLTAQGVLLPLVKTRTLEGTLGLTRKVGLSTSFRLDGRIYRTVFEEGATQALGLVDGQSIRGTVALERARGRRDTAALEYSLETALGRPLPEAGDPEGLYYLTHYGSLLWNHVLSPQSGILVQAGASYTPDAGEAGLGQRFSFYGGAAYSREVKRSNVILYVRREVAPAFGIGFSRLEYRFGVSATIPFARVWALGLSGSHVRPTTPEDAEAAYATPDEASLALGRRIGRILEISAEARYRRRGSTSAFPAIEGFQAGIFVSLLSPSGQYRARAVSAY